MRKINWENAPSTKTPLNASNLNLMQKNVEDAINGTVLYSNSSGASSGTLLDNANNYDYIEIFYFSSNSYHYAKNSVKTFKETLDNVERFTAVTQSSWPTSSGTWSSITTTIYTISGTSFAIYNTRNRTLTVNSSHTIADDNSVNNLIYKIIGYKLN